MTAGLAFALIIVALLIGLAAGWLLAGRAGAETVRIPFSNKN